MMQGFSEASERNKEPIRQVLADWVAGPALLLELGAGSGQHALYLASAFPQLRWLPSDVPAWVPALRENLASAPANVLAPLALDVTAPAWPLAEANLVFTANTLHIIGWPAVEALFAGVGRVLSRRGLLFVYGPFRYRGAYTSDSNARFDEWLKARDPASGIRDFEAVDQLASLADLHLVHDYAMPANNQLLVWRRD